MQFPTCKAPQKRASIKLSSLFREFSKAKFTGYCKFYYKNEEHIFACKEGEFVLAESEYLKGVQALQVIQSFSDILVDAIICPVSPKQFDVMLLFNSAYKIVIRQNDTKGQERGRDSIPITKIKPVSIASAVVRKGKVKSITTRIESDEPEPMIKKRLHVTRSGEESTQLRGRQINQLTLESIKELKETFKADAADLLKELHMEHLIIPKKSEKELNEGK